MIVSIVLYVFERGNFVMKSRAIDVNGRGYISDGMGNEGTFVFVG